MKDNPLIEAEQSDNLPANSPNLPLVEGEDYYVENGLYVFTESFLKRRGYCCDNGCRHCPYPKETER